MGITTVRAKVSNPAARRRVIEQEFIVDSGAIYALVPDCAAAARDPPRIARDGTLADGSHATRSIGFAIFEIDGRRGASKVIFGVPGDANLLNEAGWRRSQDFTRGCLWVR